MATINKTTTVTTNPTQSVGQVIQISLRQWYYNSDRPLYVPSLEGRISEQEYKNILDTLRPVMKQHYDDMRKYTYMSIGGVVMFALGIVILILITLLGILILVPGLFFIILAAQRRTAISRMMESDLARILVSLNAEWQPKGVSFTLIVPARRAVGNFFVNITVAPTTTTVITTTSALPTTTLLVGQSYAPPAQYYYPPAQPYPQPYQGQPYPQQPYQGQPYPQQPYQGQPYPQQSYQPEPYSAQAQQQQAQPYVPPPQNGEPSQQPPAYIPPQ